jgi:hypothetical protein
LAPCESFTVFYAKPEPKPQHLPGAPWADDSQYSVGDRNPSRNFMDSDDNINPGSSFFEQESIFSGARRINENL